MRVVVDTGVLVEVLEGSDLGEKFLKFVISSRLEPIITNLTLIELTYIICRKYGINKARELVKKLLDSGYFEVVNALEFANHIIEMKCNNSISIIDASVIATAKGLGIKALFKLEKELRDKKLENVIFIENI
jgi:hypothetical protein